MPVELFLSPLMRPAILMKALLFHPHRRTSRYTPQIIELDETSPSVHTYTVVKEFGTGSKQLSVLANPDDNVEDRLHYFVRSRAVKGAYKFYTRENQEATATLRAGLRSNVLMIQRDGNYSDAELGWHVVSHRVDANDSYRLFQLSDGQTYQWSTKGKYLERVSNMGEKESELRDRVAHVTINGQKGFTITIDESKISRELALTTAMISYIDQWNTLLGVGGIYYPYQPAQLRWKRD